MNENYRKSVLGRLFPSTKIAAYYDPFSQIINLSKYDKVEFEKISKQPDSPTIDKLALFEHELTHWIDHSATLWGQKNLILIFNALNAYINQDINEFWRIKSLYLGFSNDSFDEYFTEKYERSTDLIKTPWRYQITSGLRFTFEGKQDTEKPILFIKFNCGNDIPLLRVPISVTSILEANAINSEFMLKISLAHQISDPIDKNLKLKQISSEMEQILYHEDLALYTVIAHLTGGLNEQADAGWAFGVASSIGTLVLNLPDILYDQMKITKIASEEWERRVACLVKNKDCGFGFYNLLRNQIDSGGKKEYSIDFVLKNSNLPPIEKFEEIVVQEMQNNMSNLIDGPFKEIAIDLIKKGIEIFKIRGIDGDKVDFRNNFSRLKYLPMTIFGDTDFDESKFDLQKSLRKMYDGELPLLPERYFLAQYYGRKLGEFASVCGV